MPAAARLTHRMRNLSGPRQALALLGSDHWRMVDALLDGGPANATTLGARLGCTRQNAAYHLRGLYEVGVLDVLEGFTHLYYVDPDGLRYLAGWLETQADRAKPHGLAERGSYQP